MASCVGCKKRTTGFCYVHKQSVCDEDLFTKSSNPNGGPPNVQCNAICVIGNYFDWLADSDYTWPPRCTLCNRTLTADQPAAVIRLVCKCLHHRACLRAHLIEQLNGTASASSSSAPSTSPPVLSKDLKCPSCSSLLVDPTTQPKSKLRDSIVAFVGSLARTASSNTTTATTTGGEQKEDDTAATATPSTKQTNGTPSSSATLASPVYSSSHQHASSPSPSTSIPISSYVHSSPVGAVSRVSTLSSSSQFHDDSAVNRHPSHSSLLTSSNSLAATSSRDLESQQLLSEDTSKTKKSSNRFFALRHAATSHGAWKRWCRPQRLVLLLMAIAFLITIGFYLKFSIAIMQPSDTTSTPNTGTLGESDAVPEASLLNPQIMNAD